MDLPTMLAVHANKRTIKKVKETGDSRYFHENELDKSCFQHEVDETTITERITKTIY